VITALSATGHDRLYASTFGADGSIFAAGVIADGTDMTADFAMVVAKFRPDGALDARFATAGVARHNVAVGTNGEAARGIVLQSTGKIVISGTVEHVGAADPRDRDVALVRFNADGSLDTSFGTAGVALLDLGAGEVVGTAYVTDAAWGLAAFPDDDLVVMGSRKADARTDSDFAVIRLTPDGARRTTFATNGMFTLDLQNVNANARAIALLPGGGIIASGYMSYMSVVSPVVFKLTDQGALDPTYGVNGVFNQGVLANTTEVYGIALQGDKLVTTGYGRDTATESLDFLSLRLTAGGQLDTTYGTSGAVRIDAATFNDNSRNLVVLGDNRVLLVGGGRTSMDAVDAMLVMLTPDGARDTTFGTDGVKLYDLGGPADHFWGPAVSADKTRVAIVGIKSSPMGGNDDSALLLLTP
jgi:uncharacterized delta-60 repeat protein